MDIYAKLLAMAFLGLCALHPVRTVSLPWVSNIMFTGSTVRLNEADLALSDSVTVGAFAAVTECSKQFKYERWNCPASAFLIRPGSKAAAAAAAVNGQSHEESSSFKESSESGMNREAALVRAFTSAGITFTLTKNCSAGDFANCLCDSRFSRQKSSFEWGGCSDNYQFGSLVAKQFLDGQESGADPVSLVNLHNNAAGRVAVKKTMRRMCKCHGVSGSCATQTCWRQISDFKTVGNYLKRSYKKALKVDFANGFLSQHESGSAAGNNVQKRNGRRSRGSKRRKVGGEKDEIRTSKVTGQLETPTGSGANRRVVDNRSNFIRTSANSSNNNRRRLRLRRRRNGRVRSSRQAEVSEHEKPGGAGVVMSFRKSPSGEVTQINPRWRHRRPKATKDKVDKSKVKKRKIVFLKDSPDYCLAATSPPSATDVLGQPGVLGRKCSTEPNSPNPKSGLKKCVRLCRSCGLEAKKESKEVMATCECRFKWSSMSVECKTCKRNQIDVTCVKP